MFLDHVQFGQSAHNSGWNGAKRLHRGNKQEQNSCPSVSARQSGRKLGRCESDYSILRNSETIKNVLTAVFWCRKTDSCSIQISWKLFPVSSTPYVPNGKIQWKWKLQFQMQLYWLSRDLSRTVNILKNWG